MTKPDCLHELYGYKPSNFQYKTTNKGCLFGKSIVEINEYYILLEEILYMAFAGSIKPVSLKLNEKYVNAVAGRLDNYYYLSLFNGDNYNLYVYDTLTGLWVRR